MRYIGVDPGVSGGLAALEADGTLFGAMRMPETAEQYVEAIDIFTDNGTVPAVAVVEQVNGGLHRGKAGRMGVSSAFTFGGAWFGIKVALASRNVRVVDVRPLRWQTALACRTGGDKNVSKAAAAAMFPTVHVTHATADAMLIAEYCRRTERGGR